MSQFRLRQIVAAIMVAAMLMTSLSTVASAVEQTAPAVQTVRSQAITGTITGGQFAKIWLGLSPELQGEKVRITSDWDRVNPESNGLGFFVLSPEGLTAVQNGTANVRDANLSAGSKISPQAPDNQLTAEFLATGNSYTIVIYNDSATDANFTMTATNAYITDGSGQVKDANAPAATPTPEETAMAEGGTPAAAATEAAPAPTTAPAAPAAAAATATATPAAPAPVSTTPKEIRAQELRGELPEQNDQHFFGLEPSIPNGTINLFLTFDPQDSSELARRLNFWVLDRDGFNKFLDPNAKTPISELAIAAGSSDPQLPSNARKASFTASGFGPYVVIVYNNSRVPGSYTLRVEGGILIDDSGQSQTAMAAMATTVPTTTVTSTAPAGAATTPAAAAGSAATPATARAGEPGGTYTIKAGDTLSLIARDIYGDISLWEKICSFNNLSNCNAIEVGDVLRLPTREEIAAGATRAPAAAATPAPATPVPAAPTPAPVAATPATAASPVATTSAVTTTGALTATGSTTATSGTTGATGATGAANIIAALQAAGSFNTLVQALNAAGLTSALEGPGPFTVFAPTDAAFAALPAGALDQLLANPTGQLTQILLFHVLPGKVMSTDITDGMEATTQQGKAVRFEVTGGKIKVNGANVVVPDIEANNGVVHAIDAVILPPPE